MRRWLVAFLFLVALSGMASGQTAVIDAQNGSPLQITISSLVGTHIAVRIPTRTGSLWQVDVTATVAVSATLTRSYPYRSIWSTTSYPAFYKTVSLSTAPTTLTLYGGNPATVDHFLTMTKSSLPSSFSLTIQLTPLPFNPLGLVSSGFFVAQVNTTGITGTNDPVDVVRRVADRTLNFVSVTKLPVPFSPGFLQIFDGYGDLRTQETNKLLPGKEYFYSILGDFSSRPAQSDFLVSTGSTPVFLQSGTPLTLNLVALRQKHFIVAINPSFLTLASNHTIAARFVSSGVALQDRVSIYIGSVNLKYGGNAIVVIDGSRTSTATDFSSVVNRYTMQNLLTVVYHPQNTNQADILSETKSISVEITYNAQVFQPPVVQPDTNTDTTAVRTLYSTSDLSAADITAGWITFKASASTFFLFGAVGSFDSYGSIVGDTTSGNGFAFTTDVYSASKSGVMNAAFAVGGPLSFNYTLQRASIISNTPTSLNYVGEARIIGPRDAAMYPMVATTSSSTTLTVKANFFRVTAGYDKNICAGYQSNICSPLLMCPDQSVKFVLADPLASGQTNITSLTSLKKYSVSVLGDNVTTGNYTFAANSYGAIVVTVPDVTDGSSVAYNVEVNWENPLPNGVGGASYYSGGCDGSFPIIETASRYDSRLEVISFPRSGILILQTDAMNQTVWLKLVKPAPLARLGSCVLPSQLRESYTAPSICDGKLSTYVVHPVYPPSTTFAVANDTFVNQFPGIRDSNPSCYNALIKEECNAVFVPCVSASQEDTSYLCPDACVARFSAAGCNDAAVQALCQLHITKCNPSSGISTPPTASSNQPPSAGGSTAPTAIGGATPKSNAPGTSSASVAHQLSVFPIVVASFILLVLSL